MDKLIEIDKITAAYGNKTVLKDVSLTVWKDDFLGIIGPNGGGKTTLLKVILGLLQPVSGAIRFYQNGVEVSSLRIGYLPQLNNIDRKFPISVWEVVASGLAAEKPRFRSYTAVQKERIEVVIRQMGLEDLYTRSIGELSGGQLQRVLLGRSIVSRPQLLILDEPTRGIDVGAKWEIYNIIIDLAKQGVGIILVSSEMEEIINLSDRILVMCEGQINGCLTKEEATQEKIMNLASEVQVCERTII